VNSSPPFSFHLYVPTLLGSNILLWASASVVSSFFTPFVIEHSPMGSATIYTGCCCVTAAYVALLQHRSLYSVS
jgi:hypothetical protein